MSLRVMACVVLAVRGSVLMVAALVQPGRAAPDIGNFMPAGLAHDAFSDPLAEPFLRRVW
jgi:hypothetical protein